MNIDRARRPELMDRPDVEPGQLERSLRDLRQVNRWLGAKRSASRLVLGVAQRIPTRPVRILDVGTGGADIPCALTRLARRRGVRLEVLATDIHPTTIEVARERTANDPDIEIGIADALALPFDTDAFDIAMCHTTLHHFDPGDAARVLYEMDRVARWGIVMTDLARSRPALLGARLLAATVWRRHPITRHDGPVSVRGAYTPAELAKLVPDSPRGRYRIRRHPVFRLSLVVDRTANSH